MLVGQVANFYGPSSGGLKTTVDQLGRGYVEAGHSRLLIVPGQRADDRRRGCDRVVTLASPALGRTGYRAVLDWRRVAAILDQAGVERLEVSDKLTLWPLGHWAAARGIPAVLFSHERLDAILAARVPTWLPLAPLADRWNRRLGAAFSTIVCASAFSRAEWERVGVPAVTVALGVDLTTFHPSPRPAREVAELVCVGRLAVDKRPDLALGALEELLRGGVAAHLTMVGDGPMRHSLTRRSTGLPVTFTGHVADRSRLARLLGDADVAIAPCPAETFGLAVLEALACGTPVVATDRGAAAELLIPSCGATAPPRPAAVAHAVAGVLARPPAFTRAAARRHAENYSWAATEKAMHRVHRLPADIERPGAA